MPHTFRPWKPGRPTPTGKPADKTKPRFSTCYPLVWERKGPIPQDSLGYLLKFLRHSLQNKAMIIYCVSTKLEMEEKWGPELYEFNKLVAGLDEQLPQETLRNKARKIREILDSLALSCNPPRASTDAQPQSEFEEQMYTAIKLGRSKITKLMGFLDGKPSAPLQEELPLCEHFHEVATFLGLELNMGGIPKDATVFADPIDLFILIENLLSNALRACKRSGVAPKISVSAKLDNAMQVLVVSIKDNGIGFSPEENGAAFLDFFTTKNEVENEIHGVGLLLCRSIVERHGGDIFLKSEPGAGATITFTLPVEKSKP